MYDLTCQKDANYNFNEILFHTQSFGKQQQPNNTKCCGGSRTPGTLLHGKWELKRTHPLYKTLWHQLEMFNKHIPYSLEILLQEFTPEKIFHKSMFLAAALSVMVKCQKQPTHPSIIEQKN